MIDCVTRVRVRFSETDQMGIVYYSNYFNYFEVARLELFRKQGLPYREIESRLRCFMPAIEAHASFIRPAYLEEELEIITKAHLKTRATVEFLYEVSNDYALVARGKTLHVFINTESLKPVRVPREVLQILHGDQIEHAWLKPVTASLDRASVTEP